jgi:hypothetical protein
MILQEWWTHTEHVLYECMYNTVFMSSHCCFHVVGNHQRQHQTLNVCVCRTVCSIAFPAQCIIYRADHSRFEDLDAHGFIPHAFWDVDLNKMWLGARMVVHVYWGVLLNSVHKVQRRLKSDKNNGHFTRRPKLRFYSIEESALGLPWERIHGHPIH